MHTFLIRPNYHSHLITPPLGLGYLSSYLKQSDYQTTIIDGLNLGITNDILVEMCRDADIVGLTCLSDYFLETIDLSKKLKRAHKCVIIGGPHASVLPDLTFTETHADFVIVGEGEQTLLQLIEYLEQGKPADTVPGVYSRKTGSCTPRDVIENLDEFPFPDWEQLDPRTYQKAPHGGLVKHFPVAPIITTRGCPYDCTFCASPQLWHRRIRYRSAANVIQEIRYVVEHFGVKEIHFEDDNLTLKRAHIEAICQQLLNQNFRISWATPNGVRADTLTPDLLQLMKRSGCYSIAFGVESANQQILNTIRKHTTLDTLEQAIRMAHKAGMITQGFFIFGLPGETQKTIQHTIDFARRMPLDKAQFLLLDVLPGSELWDQLHEHFDIDWSKRSYQDVTWVPETIGKDELQRSQSKAFLAFFLRPKTLWYVLRHLKLSQLKHIWARLFDFRIIPTRHKEK